jgi:hypothetical protein
VWWRRALDRSFDPSSVLPIFMDITRHMLRAREQPAPAREEKAK